MKLKYILKGSHYKKQYTGFEQGKYALTSIQEIDTNYIAHALQSFILEEGMRYVLAQELVRRCKINDFV